MIKKIENEKTPYPYIVFAMSYISPLEHIKEIEEELKEKGFVGKVLFDLLVCEGWGCGRYLEGVFDGNTFVTFEITYPQYPVDTFTLGFF